MTASSVDATESGVRTLEQNHEHFTELLQLVAESADGGNLELAAVLAEMAAFRATWAHTGLYVSYELEALLWSLADQGLSEQPWAGPARRADPAEICEVLHITSIISGAAGMQHLVRRWIELDTSRRHSVAVSQPGWGIPPELDRLVSQSGGRVELVGDDHASIVRRAGRLRELAVEHDLIVLHLQTEDVAPILALCQGSDLPPVVLVNHADHAFWLGATVTDLVVNLRQSGLDHCRSRRAIAPDRLALLPTPLPADHADPKLSREAARTQLGLATDDVLLLSVARGPKYQTKDDVSFPMSHVPFLQEHQRCRLLVVGPDHDDEWERASQLTGGRITAVGQRFDTDLFFQAADIYVDAYPMVSITSLLEAGGFGLPLVSRCTHPPESAIWCADAPGLDAHLLRCDGFEAYAAHLARLVDDADYRTDLGGATRDAIFRDHVGDGWVGALDELYASISKTLGTGDRFRTSPRNLGQPDLSMPELLRSGASLRQMFVRRGTQLAITASTIRILARRPMLLATYVLSRLEVTARRLAQLALRHVPGLGELVRSRRRDAS